MSSTSNAQDLLVNVFRPTYRWDSNTGFVPSLTLSNVSQIITGSVTTGRLAVSDSNLNTYIGSNAGDSATGTASNVALGYSAMAGALNSSNNVAAGMFSLDGLSNSDCNVALGARTDITGRGRRNVLIGPSVTMGDGSGNILIGVDISAGSVNNRFQLGTLLYGDLSSGFLGVNTTAPTQAFDVSGVTVFRGKVGFQNDNPVYSLDVNGSIGVSERFLGSNASASAPLYSFGDCNASNSGLFVPTDASYGLGAIGVSVRGQADMVIASNKTYIYNGLDVCGTITSSGGSASFLAGAGSITEPAYSFSSDTGLGFYRTTDASGTAIGIAVGGQRRLVVGSNKLTMLGNLDVCGTFSAVSGGGGGGGSGTIAANGSAAAPSFTFSNDSTAGLYLQSAGNVGFATGGVRRMTILNTGDVSAGQLVVSGYLRDTTNGTRSLDISGGNISNSGTTESGRFTTRGTSSTMPGFNFVDATGTGFYPAQDVSYGTGALGVSVNGSPRMIVTSNKTYIYGNLDVCGTLSAAAGISGGGGGGGATSESVYYLTSGTSLAWPAGYTQAHVTAVGGGGGGGGASHHASGGGGGSGYTVSHLITSSNTLTYTIGAGGFGGFAGFDIFAGNPGMPGNATTVQGLTFSIKARGGEGGGAGVIYDASWGGGAGGAGTYGGGGGAVAGAAAGGPGQGGIGKWGDGDGGAVDGGGNGGGNENGGGSGGSGGGAEGGLGGESFGGTGYNGSNGAVGCGGGGGGGGMFGQGEGGAGGNGYIIVRFLP